jgi:hypothetical protein
MPRYYFNFINRQEKVQDVDGMELSDRRAARKQAMIAVRDVRHSRMDSVKNWFGWSIEVVDEQGLRVYLLPFSKVK